MTDPEAAQLKSGDLIREAEGHNGRKPRYFIIERIQIHDFRVTIDVRHIKGPRGPEPVPSIFFSKRIA